MTSTPDETIPLTRLTGRFVAPDGTPCSGTVAFAPPSEVTLPGSNLITTTAAVVTLDSTGAFAVGLIPTDTPGMTPYGWPYHVTERIKGQPRRDYSILLPASVESVDLADIAPVSPYAGNYRAVVGPAGPAGQTGAPGPQGPPGDASRTYLHIQSAPAATWQILHNLGRRPVIALLDVDGRVVYADIIHSDTNHVVVEFPTAFAGMATCS